MPFLQWEMAHSDELRGLTGESTDKMTRELQFYQIFKIDTMKVSSSQGLKPGYLHPDSSSTP
jgi:hypothetical protein